MNLEVCLSPALYGVYHQEKTVVVVIDVLRATSAMCTAFETGVERLIPVATVEEAQAYKDKGYIVGAERNGEVLEGFDFGNSPYSYMSTELVGKEVVMTTTNGTKAINIAKDADQVVVGSFTNYTALCEYLLAQGKDVLLLCAGWKDRFNLEDSLFAGAVVERLMESDKVKDVTDAALCAKYLYVQAQGDTYKFLHNSSHRKRLAKLNLKEDIKYCLSIDKTTAVPILKDGTLVKST